jgi:hypothetical protein
MAMHPMPTVPLPTDPDPVDEDPVRVSVQDPGQLPVQVVKPDPPLIGAVRDHLDDKPSAAIEKLKSYGKTNQELLLQLIPAMVQASRANLVSTDSPDAGVLANQLESAAALLKNKAGITTRFPPMRSSNRARFTFFTSKSATCLALPPARTASKAISPD